MKKILLISLILVLFLSVNFSVFSEELENSKTTMAELILKNEQNLNSLEIYDVKQEHHSWQFHDDSFSDEGFEKFLVIAKNTILIPELNKKDIKSEERYIKIGTFGKPLKYLYVSHDAYVIMYDFSTNQSSSAMKYKIENFDYFKNNINKLLSTQSNTYTVFSPAKNQLTKISDWAIEYYNFAHEKDLLAPCVSFGFLIDNITREQFSDLLFKFLEKTLELKWSEDSKTTFLDTENKNIITLYNEGIIKGKSDINFASNSFITRQEAATLLHRVAEYMKIKSADKSNLIYKDDEEISDWAKDAVYNMLSLGIMEGTGENFLPEGLYTKEQAITTIVRLYNVLSTEETQPQ